MLKFSKGLLLKVMSFSGGWIQCQRMVRKFGTKQYFQERLFNCFLSQKLVEKIMVVLSTFTCLLKVNRIKYDLIEIPYFYIFTHFTLGYR